MGKEKYKKEIMELFRKSPVLDYKSIERVLKNKGNVKEYGKQFIRNLILSGEIKRLTKGYYTIYDEISLSVFCFTPSYLGLQDALSVYNLWEQETIPIIITSKKVRTGIRKIFGNNVEIRRINKKYIFGINYIKQGNFYLPYSDIEKTLIDMVYFNEYISEEAIENLKKKIYMKKLNTYLNFYPKRIKSKVMKILK